jgi:hypothetical protein
LPGLKDSIRMNYGEFWMIIKIKQQKYNNYLSAASQTGNQCFRRLSVMTESDQSSNEPV